MTNSDPNNILDLLSSSSYLILNKKLLQKLGPNTAIYLSILIEKYKYFKRKDLLENGRFYCTNDCITDQTGLGLTAVLSCKNKLKELSIISSKQKGIPSKEWFYIDGNTLMGFLELTDQPIYVGSQDPYDLGHKTPPKDNKPEYNKPNKEKEKIKKEKDAPKSVVLAKQLSKIIQSRKKIYISPVQEKAWADELTKFSQKKKVEFPRIEKALDWYEDNVGGEFIPVIESGRSFVEKFLKLENAIERAETPQSGKPKHSSEKDYYEESSTLPDKFRKRCLNDE